jgi:hypothetical protein
MMATMTAELSGLAELEPGDPLGHVASRALSVAGTAANLLLGDQARSEEVVQDAVVRLQLKWAGLRRLDRAPAYLRSAVLDVLDGGSRTNRWST